MTHDISFLFSEFFSKDKKFLKAKARTLPYRFSVKTDEKHFLMELNI